MPSIKHLLEREPRIVPARTSMLHSRVLYGCFLPKMDIARQKKWFESVSINHGSPSWWGLSIDWEQHLVIDSLASNSNGVSISIRFWEHWKFSPYEYRLDSQNIRPGFCRSPWLWQCPHIREIWPWSSCRLDSNPVSSSHHFHSFAKTPIQLLWALSDVQNPACRSGIEACKKTSTYIVWTKTPTKHQRGLWRASGSSAWMSKWIR